MTGRVERLLSRFQKLKEAQPIKVNSRYAHIVGGVNQASKIWFDHKDEKDKRRDKAAHELLENLTPETLSNPQFFQEVNGNTHVRALGLLFERMVPPSGDEFDEFMVSETQSIIELYLRKFVENGASILNLDIQGDILKDKIASHLKTYAGIPRHYTEAVYPKIGLPLPPKFSTF